MKSLKELGYVTVGMVITDIHGNQTQITDIIVPSNNSHLLMSQLTKGTDLILELDYQHYLSTDVGWEHIDSRIKCVNLT